MSVVSVEKDYDNHRLTLVAEFAAPIDHVWQLWADPRRLERWWGPPGWPATFAEHDLVPGGSAKYHMTGPEGEQAHGWWRIVSVDEPRSLEFEDGFAEPDGTPSATRPTTRGRVELVATDGGTRLTVTSHFADADAMEQLAAMGMVEGMTQAIDQMDALLVAA